MKYLHKIGYHVSYLDHKLVPEVRAMFAAMMSRVPKGGIEARYKQVVESIVTEEWEASHQQLMLDAKVSSWQEAKDSQYIIPGSGNEPLNAYARVTADWEGAEDKLTVYPLHSRVQEFFDKFVGNYGHSSILELTGSPTIVIEHISWWFAYLTFDNPLVKGQEMSTRAVWRKDWPMAIDCDATPEMQKLHALGLEIARHEVDAWKAERLEKCNHCDGVNAHECNDCRGTGQKHPDFDPQGAFRFAFDRARWALPGTIETGVSHCADIRTMARVIKVMEDLATSSNHDNALTILREVKEAYRLAMPGLANLGLREAIYSQDQDTRSQIPGHINFPVDSLPNAVVGVDANTGASVYLHRKNKYTLTRKAFTSYVPNADTFAEDSRDVHLIAHQTSSELQTRKANPHSRVSKTSYLDPFYNQYAQVDIDIRCSLAASRDWHRHRTFYPWKIRVVRKPECSLEIDHHYAPISEFGKKHYAEYLNLCTELFDKYMSQGNQWQAMLCLPLGTRVLMHGQGGLRNAVYMLELRYGAAGANYEYREQAGEALQKLETALGLDFSERLKIINSNKNAL